MNILFTYFEPFHKLKTNSTMETLTKAHLPSNVQLACLPVSYAKTPIALKEAIDRYQPDVVISFGQAGNVPQFHFEYVGINLNYCPIPDNDGVILLNNKIIENGEDGLFTNLKVFELAETLTKNGIPSQVSFSASTFLCNCALYTGLHYAKEKKTFKYGFVHIPFYTGQCEPNEKYHFMDLELMIKGVELIAHLINEGKYI